MMNRVGVTEIEAKPKIRPRKAWGNAVAKATEGRNDRTRRELRHFWAGFNTSSSESGSETSTDTSDSDPEFQIGIPGARAMFGENRNPYRRALWMAISLGFLFLTIVQVKERISYYLATPISIDLKVEQTDTLEFPHVTLCSREPFNSTAMELLRPLAAAKLNKDPAEVKLPYDLLVLMDLEQLWKNLSFSINLMAYECFFGRNKSCDDNGEWLPVNTIMGPCYTFRADDEVSVTGLFNGLYIMLNASRLDGSIKPPIPKTATATTTAATVETRNQTKQPVSLAEDITFGVNTRGWRFLAHDAKATPALDIYNGINLNPAWNFDTQISLVKFVGQNVWHTPCVDDPAYDVAGCELECLSREILTRARCRLPFMNQSAILPLAPLCSTPSDYRDADYALQYLIKGSQFNVGNCGCQRQCYGNKFDIFNEVVAGKSNRIRFRVFYQDKSYENVDEDLVYELITLFCDIGNSMGLFLGASVLTGVELLEWAGYFTHKCSLKMRERVRMKKRVLKRFQAAKTLAENKQNLKEN